MPIFQREKISPNNFNLFDSILIEFERSLYVLFGTPISNQPNPAKTKESNNNLSFEDKVHSCGLMRINHIGEICAQALYRGQSLICKESEAKELLRKAADEELDHLIWCHHRIKELGGNSSILKPLWYVSSFFLGVIAGVFGEPYNLGFVVETEKQVESHLEKHLLILPKNDQRSREILEKMKEDEKKHADEAKNAGGVELNFLICIVMSLMSKIMINISYKI
ncbi:MAG: 2-polyprenyl-3-methyl-6-methoxy-1,4-benzoquinone monooxygenase [Bordetella sp.]|nr:MAG: 2-polyprenyl-3-methyl-6-methoxy-1,4-benzoquinone monooxygenase [Bordetella sp.]